MPAAPALMEAEEKQRGAMTVQLIKSFADVNATGGLDVPWPPLLGAVRHGHCASLRALLNAQADIKSASQDGRTPLHFIASLGAEVASSDVVRELVSDLIRSTAKVDACDPMGVTPLHVAAGAGRADALRTLATKQANINARDKAGRTPLHFIAQSQVDAAGALEAVKIIIDLRTWDLDGAVDREGRTALHVAAMVGQAGYVEVLVAKEANVGARDREGHTPLHLAVECPEIPSEDVISRLLRARAQADERDGAGRTPMQLALEAGRAHLLDLPPVPEVGEKET